MSQPTPFKGIKKTPLSEAIERELGLTGKIISGSKSGYRLDHPNSLVYFNACIYDEYLTQVWFGDIDLTLDNEKLKKIASVVEQPFYVTPQNYRADFTKMNYADLEKTGKIIKFNHIKRVKKQ